METLHEYEISNPSDKCFVSAAEDIVACTAITFLGEGAYPCCDKEGKPMPSVYLFGDDANVLYKDRFGVSLEDFIYKDPDNLIKVANCLETFRYAGKRSSVNDIGARAKIVALRLRKK